MTTCLGKRCSFGLLCVSFVNFINFRVCPSFPFGFEGGMWDVIVIIPALCLSIYFIFHFHMPYILIFVNKDITLRQFTKKGTHGKQTELLFSIYSNHENMCETGEVRASEC